MVRHIARRLEVRRRSHVSGPLFRRLDADGGASRGPRRPSLRLRTMRFDSPELGRAIMRVLIACETSGIVRRAFLARGHDAWSCDLLPSEDASNRHMIGDARDLLGEGWDLLMVAHPPCTRLCNSGVRWLTSPPPGRTKAELWAELD